MDNRFEFKKKIEKLNILLQKKETKIKLMFFFNYLVYLKLKIILTKFQLRIIDFFIEIHFRIEIRIFLLQRFVLIKNNNLLGGK